LYWLEEAFCLLKRAVPSRAYLFQGQRYAKFLYLQIFLNKYFIDKLI